MTASWSGPFDPSPEDGGDACRVLGNARGEVSLWPVWRAVPPGWHHRFGPASHEVCARWVETAAADG